jgi:hypothetical protein
MPTKPKSGSAQINVELPPDVLDAVKAFAEARGQTLKYVVWRALVRHLDNPPPIAPEPRLPDAPAEVVPKDPPKKRGPKPRAK